MAGDTENETGVRKGAAGSQETAVPRIESSASSHSAKILINPGRAQEAEQADEILHLSPSAEQLRIAQVLERRLSPDQARTAMESLRKISLGTATSQTHSRVVDAFRDAGLLDAKGALNFEGEMLLTKAGVAFFKNRILPGTLGQGVSTTLHDLTKAGEEAGEVPKTLRAVAKTAAGTGLAKSLASKLPLISEGIALVTTVVGMAGAALAGHVAKTSRGAQETPEERRAREFKDNEAQMKRTADVAREAALGLAGALPVPGVDLALRTQIERCENQLQAEYDRHLSGPERIDPEDLIRQHSPLDRAVKNARSFNKLARQDDTAATSVAAPVHRPQPDRKTPRPA